MSVKKCFIIFGVVALVAFAVVGTVLAQDSHTSGVWVLEEDAISLTFRGDTYLDLNGYNVKGVTVTDGTLYCMDSATDDYDVADGVYGMVSEVTGAVVAAEGYLPVDGEDGISFHKVCFDITSVTLRPGKVGMYYSCRFMGNPLVADKILSYGVALNAVGEPTEQTLGTTTACSVFANFPTMEKAGSYNSTLLSNIMSTEDDELTNRLNANRVIYARVYIRTEEGYLFGRCASVDLQTLVEAVDARWQQLTEEQKSAVSAMYRDYESAMGIWNIPNLKEATSVKEDIPSTMTKQSYVGVNYWLYTPENPTADMPLIVYLHGGSGKGDDLELITGVDGFPQYIRDGVISCDGYIIFPQCPSSQKGWKTMGGKIENLIRYTCATYGLCDEKVSLTGHSMGGTGTWSLALDKPDLFYKIAPMSGSVTVSDSNLEILSNIPVWAFVGDNDKIVAPDTSIAMIQALQELGADAKLTVLEGADHFAVPGLGYLESDVIRWLIS